MRIVKNRDLTPYPCSNVLKGEMSIVGPGPEVPEVVDLLS